MDRGHIYKSHYEGWYCVADEAFVTESQISEKNDANKTKISVESGHPVEWTSEENYMFKLNALLPDVLYWIKTGELLLYWEYFYVAFFSVNLPFRLHVSKCIIFHLQKSQFFLKSLKM